MTNLSVSLARSGSGDRQDKNSQRLALCEAPLRAGAAALAWWQEPPRALPLITEAVLALLEVCGRLDLDLEAAVAHQTFLGPLPEPVTLASIDMAITDHVTVLLQQVSTPGDRTRLERAAAQCARYLVAGAEIKRQQEPFAQCQQLLSQRGLLARRNIADKEVSHGL